MKYTTKHNFVTWLILIIVFLISIFAVKDLFEDYKSCADSGGVMAKKFIGGYICVNKE